MTGKMKAVVLTGPRKLEWVEKDIPETKPGHLLIKLEYCGVCGSDLHFFQDGKLGNWVPDGPLVLGHEPGGVVVEVGEGVTGYKVGDKVSIEPGVGCGQCEYCKTGRYNLCDNMTFMAIPNERDGVYAEYCAHPANMCYKLPDNMDTMEGALIEPLAVGFHAVLRSGARVGQSAIVLGCGCIGLCTIMVLKACGVSTIYATDVIDVRLKKAEELGAIPLNAKEVNIEEFAKKMPGGGADHVYETAGSEPTTLQTARIVKKGGTVTMVGMCAESVIPYDMSTLINDKEALLVTVMRYRNLYPTAIAAVSSGSIPLKSIVSDVFEFDKVIEGMTYNVDNKANIIKAVVKY